MKKETKSKDLFFEAHGTAIKNGKFEIGEKLLEHIDSFMDQLTPEA